MNKFKEWVKNLKNPRNIIDYHKEDIIWLLCSMIEISRAYNKTDEREIAEDAYNKII